MDLAQWNFNYANRKVNHPPPGLAPNLATREQEIKKKQQNLNQLNDVSLPPYTRYFLQKLQKDMMEVKVRQMRNASVQPITRKNHYLTVDHTPEHRKQEPQMSIKRSVYSKASTRQQHPRERSSSFLVLKEYSRNSSLKNSRAGSSKFRSGVTKNQASERVSSMVHHTYNGDLSAARLKSDITGNKAGVNFGRQNREKLRQIDAHSESHVNYN